MRTLRTGFATTSAVAAATLSLAACGGGDDATSTTAAASDFEMPAECPPVDGSAEPQAQFEGPPPRCFDEATSPTATISTNMGDIEVELLADKAPNTVNNFIVLSRYHYYDNTDCHRIIPGFMAQCGDPTGTGTGDPGYKFEDELPEAGEYQIGSLAMANAGPNTQGSQFFIITGDAGVNLPPDYTLFGQVTGGMTEVLTEIDAAGNPDPAANGMPPAQPVTIESITING